ncbi:hypothetical protein [Aquimarina spongiae]|uniref:Outer membrane protein beta-barrel domain-containing protein n=1 Tax=Aquimarina spongiae TaxID=570521 RepID=A0A1M6HER0_9FLAO|nr:hypothetical protein [Aquimarina spongiae]SHJ20692.1 hypothetical protein SAMN04488508_106247 [Aquimarina spongiae]
MKKTIFIAILLGSILTAKAQDTQASGSQNASVEKSVFGIQAGFAGLWVHNELKLTNQLALRTEIGFDAYENDDYYPDAGFLFSTVLTLEPRWYYNLNKRASQSKSIDGNSGNFFALKSSLRLEDLLIEFGDDEDVNMVNNLSIVPTWGIRRNLGKHFNYEAGAGIGYIHFFAKDAEFEKDKGELAINLHLRIGYRF